MKNRVFLKTISMLIAGIFLLQTVLHASDLSTDNLSPKLRLTEPDFKELFTAAGICKFLEGEGRINDKSDLDDIISNLEKVQRGYGELSITKTLYEVIIEIPQEGMAVRYFDHRNASVLTSFNIVSKLRTKIISDTLTRQIIHRPKLLTGYKPQRVFEVSRNGKIKPISTFTIDDIEKLITKEIVSFHKTQDIRILKDLLVRLERISSFDQADFKKVVTAMKEISRDYPILTDKHLWVALLGTPPKVRETIKEILDLIAVPQPDMSKVKVLILASGTGMRSWPKSTAKRPKQLLTGILPSGRSSLQEAIHNLTVDGFIPKEQIYVTTTEIIKDGIISQAASMGISEDNVLVEPVRAGTALALGYAAKYFEAQDPDSTIFVMMADTYVTEIEKFQESVTKAIDMAQAGPYVVSIGVEPDTPSTQYGYIQTAGETAKEGVCRVISFTEKPDREQAIEFLKKKKQYLWEGGMLAMDVKTVLRAFEELSPEYHEAISKIGQYINGDISHSSFLNIYKEMSWRIDEGHPVAMDYILFELIAAGEYADINFAVVPSDMNWMDIGNLLGESIRRINAEKIDADDNLILGDEPEDITLEDVTGCNILPSEGRDVVAKGISGVVLADSAFANSTLAIRKEEAIYFNGITGNLREGSLRDNIQGGATSETAGARIFGGANNTVYTRDGLAVISGLTDYIMIRTGEAVKIYGPKYQQEARDQLIKLLNEDIINPGVSVDMVLDDNNNLSYSVSKKKDYRVRFTLKRGETSYVFAEPAPKTKIVAHKTRRAITETLLVSEIKDVLGMFNNKRRDIFIPTEKTILDLLERSAATYHINKLWKSRFVYKDDNALMAETAIASRFERKQFEVISKWIKNGERVLDLATGSGRFAIGIAETYPESEVIGVDLLDEALDLAREGASRRKLKNVRFVKANILDIKSYFPEKTFDVVYSVGVWQNLSLDECDVFVKNILYLVKPGGTVIISSPNGESPIYRFWRRVVGENLKHRFGLERYVTKKEIKEILNKHGIKISYQTATDPLYCLKKMYHVDPETGAAQALPWAPAAKAIGRFLDYFVIDPVDLITKGALSRAIGNDIIFRGVAPSLEKEEDDLFSASHEEDLESVSSSSSSEGIQDRSYLTEFSINTPSEINTTSLTRAQKWFLSSKIQNLSEDRRFRGGINGWYDEDKENYPFIYTEITGYALSAFIYLYVRNGDMQFLDRAELAAEWIITEAIHDRGGVSTRLYYDEQEEETNFYSFKNQILFTFDSGIVLQGMMDLYKATGNDQYLAIAMQIGSFMMDMQREDGFFDWAMDGKTGEKLPEDETQWSRQYGAYHAKAISGLVDLFKITGDKKYRHALIRFAEAAVSTQKEDGRFVTTKATGDTNLHAHLYAARGLLYIGTKLSIPRYVTASEKATKWVFDNQLPNGGIPQIYEESGDDFIKHERSDVLGQALRLGLYVYEKSHYDNKKLLGDKLTKLKRRLEKFQTTRKGQVGGLRYGKDRDGKFVNCVNSWSTMFAVQAMYKYERIFTGEVTGKSLEDVKNVEGRSPPDQKTYEEIQLALANRPDTKIGIVVGTRPEIIKMWPIINYCQINGIPYFILHTNQHYSEEMSDSFFSVFNMPHPKYNLHRPEDLTDRDEMLNWMSERMISILEDEKPSHVFVQGDTNSAYAGALAAREMDIPIAHVEAGLRTYEEDMPEELNRVGIDRMATYYFCPTKIQIYNLHKEHLYTAGGRKELFITGNTSVDAVNMVTEMLETTEKDRLVSPDLLEKMGVKSGKYFLLTLHRVVNVDNEDTLKQIIESLDKMSEKYNLPILFPVHPRTRKVLDKFNITLPESFKTTKAVGNYFEMLELVKNAALIFTDSGGIQEEAASLGFPTVILRSRTERVEAVSAGASMLAGPDATSIENATSIMLSRKRDWENPFGKGRTAEFVIKAVLGLPLPDGVYQGRMTELENYSDIVNNMKEEEKFNKASVEELYLELFKKTKEKIASSMRSGKKGISIRIPVEVLELIDSGNLRNYFDIFRQNPNVYVELFCASGSKYDVTNSMYQEYGLEKRDLPEGFERSRENTITLFMAQKGETIDNTSMSIRLGSFDMTPTDSILSPVGLHYDSVGLIRGTLLGLSMMDIAQDIERERENGLDLTEDQQFMDKIQTEVLEVYKHLWDSNELDNVNITPQDIMAMTSGNINDLVGAVNKLVKLLPVSPVSINEISAIFYNAKKVLLSA